MRLFLKKILLFSLLVVMALAIGEIIVRRMDTPYKYKATWLREHGEKINTLILGSSHTYYGLNPAILGDSVFNLANISQTPEYDLALLKEFKPFIPHLRRVVIPISYFTYRDPKLEDMDRGLCVQYKVGMKLPLHSNFSIYNFSISDFKSYSGRLRNLVLPQELNLCDSLGFGLGFQLSHRAPNWKEGASKRVADLTQNTPGRPEEVEKELEEIISYCNRNNLEVVFITTPVCVEFRNAEDKKQYGEMRENIRRMREKFDVKYFDFYSSSKFDDDDFHDPDHLSDIGAIKLTRMLKDSLANYEIN